MEGIDCLTHSFIRCRFLVTHNTLQFCRKFSHACIAPFHSSPFDSENWNNNLIAEDDILVRKELEALAKDFPDKFKLHYTVDRAPTDGSWKYSTGFITKGMIEKYCLFNGSAQNTQVLMCGPPPMIKFACVPNLQELGFTNDDWFAF